MLDSTSALDPCFSGCKDHLTHLTPVSAQRSHYSLSSLPITVVFIGSDACQKGYRFYSYFLGGGVFGNVIIPK